jgi:predicted amidophosphoribosyltransferase
LDHVNNDGAEHRKRISKTGIAFYRWLVKCQFPKNPPLQVLCYNCNASKQRNGGVCEVHVGRLTTKTRQKKQVKEQQPRLERPTLF